MLIFFKAPLFLWAEAIATACYTQNHSLIHIRHVKTPYEILYDRKLDLTYFHVFGALCYPTNDNEDPGKMKPKADIGIFIGYAPAKKAYWIYNRHTQRIMETIHVKFNELTTMAFKQFSSGPEPHIASPVPAVVAPEPVDLTGTPSLTSIDQDVPSPSTSQTPQESQSLVIPSNVKEQFHDIEVAHLDNDPFFGVLIPEPNSEESSSRNVILTNVHLVNQPPEHLIK
ncbi:integrase, catalytic region, zinc finger, CCHC-type containing protein [Tanacetum coccineum]